MALNTNTGILKLIGGIKLKPEYESWTQLINILPGVGMVYYDANDKCLVIKVAENIRIEFDKAASIRTTEGLFLNSRLGTITEMKEMSKPKHISFKERMKLKHRSSGRTCNCKKCK